MMNYTNMNALAEKEGFIVVYPQGVLNTWNAVLPTSPAAKENVDDVVFIEHVLDDLEQQLSIATNSINCAGISNGGQMCYKLAAESGRITSIAVVASGIGSPSDYPKSSPIPTMVIHGTEDTHIPYSGGTGNGLVSDFSYMPVAATVDYLRRVNQVENVSPGAYDPYKKFVESSEITSSVFSSQNGSDLVLISVNGGGHTWPGAASSSITDERLGATTQALDANQAIWNFFEAHPAEVAASTVTAQTSSQPSSKLENVQAAVSQAAGNGGGNGGGGRRGR